MNKKEMEQLKEFTTNSVQTTIRAFFNTDRNVPDLQVSTDLKEIFPDRESFDKGFEFKVNKYLTFRNIESKIIDGRVFATIDVNKVSLNPEECLLYNKLTNKEKTNIHPSEIVPMI